MSNTNIRIDYYRHDLYDKFVDEWDLFNTYVDVFVFAASVGYATVDIERVKAYDDSEFKGTGDEQGEMLWMHFSNKTNYRTVAAALAYQLFETPDALSDPNIQLESLARFAKAGMETLEQEFGDSVSTPRDGLLAFIDEYENPNGSKGNDHNIMEEISSSFEDNVPDQ